MSAQRTRLTLVPLADRAVFESRYQLADVDEPDLTLGKLLSELPAFSLTPIDGELLERRVARLRIEVAEPSGDVPLYWPPGMAFAGRAPASGLATGSGERAADDAATAQGPGGGGAKPGLDHPVSIDTRTAVLIAHDEEIRRAAAYLEPGHDGMSVLVRCEKLLVEHLAAAISARSGRTVRVIEPGPDGGGRDLPGFSAGRRQGMLAGLQAAVTTANPATDLIVVPHLDLLAGGSDAALTSEARELTDVLYERSGAVLLAFVDPSLSIPEVLANRFAVRIAIDILPREVRTSDGVRVPIGRALVTAEEAKLFAFGEGDATALYKHIAGMNAARLRHAVSFAFHQYSHSGATFGRLVAELRLFKATTSNSFELPNVSFDQIGGYPDVRAELRRALDLLARADSLPEKLRHELVPRGFIFHGPPGTGKTLFAKAVATAFDATILVVSGPEVTDMYVGESERKVREIFAEARRNAPAVIVFDEFDSIAARRSGREDGGSRAGNAIVAQLLTEMDGFRPEVPVLIIGTTNRLDIIDEALLRPSRFKAIRIDLPDLSARKAIARVHARHFDIEVSEELLDRIAVATNRMNGDEIRSIFRDARANNLVGHPPRPADARALGELVGQLRRATQERDVDRDRGQRPRTGAGRTGTEMVVLTPRRTGQPGDGGSAEEAEPTAEEVPGQ